MKPFPNGCRLSKDINLGVFDVYNVVGEIQKILQFINILPHEKFDKFNELLDILATTFMWILAFVMFHQKTWWKKTTLLTTLKRMMAQR